MTPEELKKVTKRSDTNYYVYDQYGNNPMQTIARWPWSPSRGPGISPWRSTMPWSPAAKII